MGGGGRRPELARSCWEDKCDELQEGTVRFHPREVSSVEAAREDEKLTVGRGGSCFSAVTGSWRFPGATATKVPRLVAGLTALEARSPQASGRASPEAPGHKPAQASPSSCAAPSILQPWLHPSQPCFRVHMASTSLSTGLRVS